MITIRWRLRLTDDSPSRIFKMDETKSWKKNLVKGHDIAEVIAQDLWDNEAMTVGKVFIIDPEPYRGEYTIATRFTPEFEANKVLAEGEAPPASRPRTTKKH